MKKKHAKKVSNSVKTKATNFKKQKIADHEEILSDSGESITSKHDVTDTEEAFELETVHEKHIRLTKKALKEAIKIIDSDGDDEPTTLTARLQEQALQTRGKLFVKVAHKYKPISEDSIVCLRGHKKSVNCVCISYDCDYMFSGGKDGKIIKWSLSKLIKLCSVDGKRKGVVTNFHSGPILCIAISDNFKYMASGSADMSIIVWNPETLKPMFRLKRNFAPITAISFRRQSNMLFSGDRSGRVCVWNMPLTELLQDQGAATKIEVLSICGLSSERCISSSGFGSAGICLWKVEEEVCVQYNVKNIFEHSIECVYAVNDDLFVGGSTANYLYLWHVSKGSPICTIHSAHPFCSTNLIKPTDRPSVNWVTSVTGLFGTDLVASGSSSGHIQLWRVVVDGTGFSISSRNVQNNDDGADIPRGGSKLRIHYDTTRIERVVNGEFYLGGYINSLVFSNNGKWLAVGVGQEHRLGRWEERRKVNDVVCMLPINIPISQL